MRTHYGYQHGDRVRDTRDGATGTVWVISDGSAEVRWDGLPLADELIVALPHLQRVGMTT